MAIYNIQGNTVEGSKVNEDVEADNEALALSQIHSTLAFDHRKISDGLTECNPVSPGHGSQL